MVPVPPQVQNQMGDFDLVTLSLTPRKKSFTKILSAAFPGVKTNSKAHTIKTHTNI